MTGRHYTHSHIGLMKQPARITGPKRTLREIAEFIGIEPRALQGHMAVAARMGMDAPQPTSRNRTSGESYYDLRDFKAWWFKWKEAGHVR